MEKNDILTVTIEDLTAEGEGVGKADGFPLFIKDTVPGDVVRCSVMKVKKGYGYARLQEILTASPDRSAPRCPIAKSCGGCQLQHLSYEAQLRFKTKRVADALQRIGGLSVRMAGEENGEDAGSVLLYPALGMKEPWQYRNKAQVPVGKDRDGNLVMGFYARHSHEIIPQEDCAISFPETRLVLQTVREWMLRFGISAYDEASGTGILRHILARKGMKTGEILVCLVSRKRKVRHENELAEMLRASVPGFVTLTVNMNAGRDNVILGQEGYVAYGPGFIEDEIGGLRFRISPESFFQVNSEQMEVLYGKAMEFAGLTGNETVWDLYSGIGTISLFLAKKARQVYGVEVVPQAVLDARENAALNGLQNVTFYEGAAEEVLPRWRAEHAEEKIDVIVVDPPRKGLDLECLETICLIAPPKVVYVSCDPATLARDLALFKEHGYRAELAQPVDQFCQTTHIETVVSLTRGLKTIFESERILFVEVSEDLAEDYLTMVNDFEHVNRFISGKHRAFTLENEFAWVRDQLEKKAPVFSMIEKKSGQFIGNIELMHPSDTEAELGIAITGEKQDKGFGTEAVLALTDYARNQMGLQRVFLRTNPQNARAIHVYEKCGFREYKRTEEHIFMEEALGGTADPEVKP